MRACSWLPPVVQRVRLRRTLWRLDEMSSDILRSVTTCQSVLSLDRTYEDVNLREIRDSNRPDRNTIGRSMRSRSESPALTVRKGRLLGGWRGLERAMSHVLPMRTELLPCAYKPRLSAVPPQPLSSSYPWLLEFAWSPYAADSSAYFASSLRL